jgi:hypothetical protein
MAPTDFTRNSVKNMLTEDHGGMRYGGKSGKGGKAGKGKNSEK